MTTALDRYEYPKDREAIARRWRRSPTSDAELDRSVWEIIEDVRDRGDQALVELTEHFDGIRLRAADLRIPPEALEEAWNSLPDDLRAALELAKERIERFHSRQRREGFVVEEADGLRLEQRVIPLERVGLYIPGFKAAYPSTVLMCAVPAFLAGVESVVMVTPPHGGTEVAEMDLAVRATWGAAHLAGVREAYQVGGAQAVAALAFGTETIPAVDKVVGPGNQYVATAKKLLYGVIDIDAVAGPSEVMILADETAKSDLIAVDLLAQAEHDEEATSIVVAIGSGDAVDRLVAETLQRVNQLAYDSPRQAITMPSLQNNGALIRVETREQAVELANLRAPEHLEIMTSEPRELADGIRNAGAIFLGPWTPEALGDYIAGPNHTLPTGGTARFFSPLGVEDFVKNTNVLEATRATMKRLGPPATILADVEGLAAHAKSLRKRMG